MMKLDAHVPHSTGHKPWPAQSPLQRNLVPPSVTSPTLHRKTSQTSIGELRGRSSSRLTSQRRVSSQPHTTPKQPSVTALDEKLGVDAASIAREYFASELRLHDPTADDGLVNASNTVVIFQDHCYGHRYSRPRTSRSNLNSIVERPERVKACVLGTAAAYVRLGDRHDGGRYPPKPGPSRHTPASIPFRIHKTSRIVDLRSKIVTTVHGEDWMNELASMCDDADSKLSGDGKELQRSGEAKDGAENSPKPALDVGDLYLCKESRQAMEGCIGAVCEAVDCVLDQTQHPRAAKQAFVCIRPPGHHCSAEHPAGFCWVNNVQVGISYAMLEHEVTHAAIIDFDLHHGDGSQSITWDHNEHVSRLPKNAPNNKRTAIGYFSLHDINSYPCEMSDRSKVQNASLCIEGAHGQTIWNCHLQAWKTEAEFWELYEQRYLDLLEKTRTFLVSQTSRISASSHTNPKAMIFLSSGFDASEWESPGMQRHKVNVPTDFYARFTQDILKIAEDPATAVEGRLVSVLEGGYSDRALCSGVFSHLSGLVGRRVEVGHPTNDSDGSLAFGLASNLNLNGSSRVRMYDSNWWTGQALADLEACRYPLGPPTAPKRPKASALGNFTSATQSFNAKVVLEPKGRRISSSTFTGLPNYPNSPTNTPPKPIIPPPPTVHWTVAACELAQLLIPLDRDTSSHNAEELNPEPKIKKERVVTLVIDDGEQLEGKASGRQLRERKPKEAMDVREPPRRTISRTDRRRTVAGAGVGIDAPRPPIPDRHRRRSSATSNASGFSDSSLIQSIASAQNKSRVPSISHPGPSSTASQVPSFPTSTSALANSRSTPSNKISAQKQEALKLPKRPVKSIASSSRQPARVPKKPVGTGQSGATTADIEALSGSMKSMKIRLVKPPTQAANGDTSPPPMPPSSDSQPIPSQASSASIPPQPALVRPEQILPSQPLNVPAPASNSARQSPQYLNGIEYTASIDLAPTRSSEATQAAWPIKEEHTGPLDGPSTTTAGSLRVGSGNYDLPQFSGSSHIPFGPPSNNTNRFTDAHL